MYRLALVGSLSLAVLLLLAPQGRADAIDVAYTGLGTFQATSVTTGGVTATGSNALQISASNPLQANDIGLGVVGGLADHFGTTSNLVDSGEWVQFTFAFGPATAVGLHVHVPEWLPSGDLDGDGTGHQLTLQAFAGDGSSLGSAASLAHPSGLAPGAYTSGPSNSLVLDVSGILGVSAMSSLRVTATDAFSIYGISATSPTSPVPEPGAFGLLALGLVALGAMRGRRIAS